MDISPEKFKIKSTEEKTLLLKNLLKDLKGSRSSFKAYKDNTYKEIIDVPCYNVSRPLIQDSGYISVYELDYILSAYPEGEECKLKIYDLDKDYERLYYFKKGHCVDCLKDTLIWSIGDKRFVYYCVECNQEKNFFCKHCRYD